MARIGSCMPWGAFAPDEGTPNRQYRGMKKGFDYLTRECGFDYIEFSVGDLLSLPEEDAAILENDYKNGLFRIESTNCFMCRELPVTGPQVSFDALEELAVEAYAQMSRFGVQISVFGSGKAREYPEGFSESTAEQQFYDFLEMLGKHAARYGITVCLEPLRKEETNLINTVAQAYEFVKFIGLDNVKITADLYHMSEADEPFETLMNAKDLIFHMHAAEAGDRTFPGNHGCDYLVKGGEMMKKIGYSGRISSESRCNDYIGEMKAAADFMNKNFK